jgi:hypothetical protein
MEDSREAGIASREELEVWRCAGVAREFARGEGAIVDAISCGLG